MGLDKTITRAYAFYMDEVEDTEPQSHPFPDNASNPFFLGTVRSYVHVH